MSSLPIKPAGDPYQRLADPLVCPLPAGLDDPPLILRELSVRHQRRLALWCMAGIVLGSLLWVAGSEWRNEVLAPGPLSSVHAQILRNQGHQRCATCHGAGTGDLAAWLADTLTGGHVFPENQSHLCLACHQQTLPVATALNPHGVASSLLSEMTAYRRRELGLPEAVITDAGNRELACATCHREHHGAQFDLTAISNDNCQSCHIQYYDRWEGTHPDFRLAASSLADRRIGFDHGTHARTHFAARNETFDCRSCHQMDEQGAFFTTVNYEAACSECHQTGLQAQLAAGVPFWQWPQVDSQQLSRVGVDLLNWPPTAIGDFDGQVSPVIQLLLLGDPESPLGTETGKPYDFFEVDPSDPTRLREAGNWAQAIAKLHRELSDDPASSLAARLQTATGWTFSRRELANLFPQWVAGQPRTAAATTTPLSRDVAAAVARIALDEVLAINPLANKFTGAAQAALSGEVVPQAPPANRAGTPQTQEQVQPGLSPKNSAPPSPLADKSNKPLGSDTLPPSSGQGEMLAENPLKSKGPQQVTNQQGWTDNLEGTRSSTATPTLLTAPVPERPPAVEPFSVSKPTTPPAPLSSQRPNAAMEGNPVRDSEVYQPVGHADPTLQAWMELAVRIQAAQPNTPLARVSHQLLSSAPFQACARCHQTSAASLAGAILWEDQSPARGSVGLVSLGRTPSALTKFSHRPHLLLRQCTDCHQMQEPRVAESPLAAIAGSEVLVSDFRGVTKLDCASCHRQGEASNACSHCHHYHWPPRTNPPTEIQKAIEVDSAAVTASQPSTNR